MYAYFFFFCIARLLRENQNATCPMCREILFQSTENIRTQQLSSHVNVDINFTENTDGTINPQIEINIDDNQNNRENAAGLIQRKWRLVFVTFTQTCNLTTRLRINTLQLYDSLLFHFGFYH